MRMRIALLASLVAVVLAVASTAATGERHFSLVRSVPAAGTTLEKSPEALQTFFNQVPAAGVSRLRLLRGEGERAVEIEIGKTAISGEHKSMTAPLTAALAPGAYRMVWRGAGDDGHVMSGEIPFVIKAPSLQ